jgi:UDP-N-acetylmuramyl tripeptide synthase
MMSPQCSLMQYTVGELLSELAGEAFPEALTVSGICSDSRQVGVGDLFLALATSGDAVREHVREAVSRGAGAVVVSRALLEAIDNSSVCVIAVADVCEAAGRIADRFYAHPSGRLTLVGVTGTNGKTSVSHYLAHALQQFQETERNLFAVYLEHSGTVCMAHFARAF